MGPRFLYGVTPWIQPQSHTISFYEKNKQTRFCLLFILFPFLKICFALSQTFREREDLVFVVVFWGFFFLFFSLLVLGEAGIGAREKTEFGTDQSALQWENSEKCRDPGSFSFWLGFHSAMFKWKENIFLFFFLNRQHSFSLSLPHVK